MERNRHLDWDGCNNVRDLGGVPAGDGSQTRWGALVRSDTPSKLTAKGWEALCAYGISTIITLRTEGLAEPELDLPELPVGISVVQAPIEDLGDEEFLHQWAASDLWCTPLYYQDALQRWPHRHAFVVKAFAQAQPGGVLIHCKRGHDRTGIMSLIFLSLVGVSTEEIVSDYELSKDSERDEILLKHGITSRQIIFDILASLDSEVYLLAAGLSEGEIAATKDRLLEPAQENSTLG